MPAEENKATTLRGVYSRGEFLQLAPSGKRIALSVITMERMKGGKIVERQVVLDVPDLMQQLGAAPAAPGAGEER